MARKNHGVEELWHQPRPMAVTVGTSIRCLTRRGTVLLEEGLFGGKAGVFTSSSFLLSFVEQLIIGHRWEGDQILERLISGDDKLSLRKAHYEKPFLPGGTLAMSLMAFHQKGIPKHSRNDHHVGICSITSVFKTASLNHENATSSWERQNLITIQKTVTQSFMVTMKSTVSK